MKNIFMKNTLTLIEKTAILSLNITINPKTLRPETKRRKISGTFIDYEYCETDMLKSFLKENMNIIIITKTKLIIKFPAEA